MIATQSLQQTNELPGLLPIILKSGECIGQCVDNHEIRPFLGNEP